MFENTSRARRALGAATGSTLSLGLAVVVGLIPQPGGVATSVRAAAVAPVAVAPPDAGEDAHATVFDTLPPAPPTTALPLPVVPVPATEAPSTAPPPASPASVPAVPAPEVATPEAVTADPDPVPSSDPAEPTEPAPVPRRQPSEAEVDAALEGLRPFVRSIFSPGPSHVADAGDRVCTAFDEGQSIEEVKAAGVAMVEKVPFTSVRPGADDYVVRTAVALYCPGHAPKLA